MATGIDVTATRGDDSVLVSGCRAQFGRFFLNKEGMSHSYDSLVAGPAARRDNALARKMRIAPFPLLLF